MSNYEPVGQEVILGKNSRVTILNTLIDVLTMKETVDLVEQYVNTKTPLHLMGVNADKINEVNRNERMKQIVNSCGIINADGASVIMASKYLNKPLPERVAGVDLMQHLVALSAHKNYTIYLLGAKQEVVIKTAEVLQEKYPTLRIVGVHDGYFKEDQWSEIYEEISNANPDFL